MRGESEVSKKRDHVVILPTGMPYDHRVLRQSRVLAEAYDVQGLVARHGPTRRRKKPWDSVSFFHKDMRVARVLAAVQRGLLKLDRLTRRKERVK